MLKSILPLFLLTMSLNVLAESVSVVKSGLPISKIDVSSSIGSDNNVFGAQYLIDSDNGTAWCSKLNTKSGNEWMTIHFDKPKAIIELYFYNGFARNKYDYSAHARVKQVELLTNRGMTQVYDLKDTWHSQSIRFLNPMKVSWIKLKLLDVYRGDDFNNVCINHIEPIYKL